MENNEAQVGAAAAKQAELTERVQKFNAELIPLLGKYKLALGAQAFLFPDGRIGSRPIVLDEEVAKSADGEKKPEDGIESAE